MTKFNSVAVAPVGSLEHGDLVAFEFLGNVVSGIAVAVVDCVYQLTPDQIEYLKEQRVKIPENKMDFVAGPSQRLLFGDFEGHGPNYKHMFIETTKNVAIFPRRDRT